MSKTILTSLQKGLFTAETAEYAEQYLMKAFASFAFFAVSFCSGLNFAIQRYPSVLDGLPRCLLPCSTIPGQSRSTHQSAPAQLSLLFR